MVPLPTGECRHPPKTLEGAVSKSGVTPASFQYKPPSPNQLFDRKTSKILDRHQTAPDTSRHRVQCVGAARGAHACAIRVYAHPAAGPVTVRNSCSLSASSRRNWRRQRGRRGREDDGRNGGGEDEGGNAQHSHEVDLPQPADINKQQLPAGSAARDPAGSREHRFCAPRHRICVADTSLNHINSTLKRANLRQEEARSGGRRPPPRPARRQRKYTTHDYG